MKEKNELGAYVRKQLRLWWRFRDSDNILLAAIASSGLQRAALTTLLGIIVR